MNAVPSWIRKSVFHVDQNSASVWQKTWITLQIVCLACVTCWPCGQYLAAYQREATTLARISELGGVVSLSTHDAVGSDALQLGIFRYMQGYRISTVSFAQQHLSDEDLAGLTKLSRLETLILAHTNISSSGLETIGKLSTLRYLDVSENDITDDGIRHLQELEELVFLNLNGTRVTDDGVAALRDIRTLEFVGVVNTDISEDAQVILPNVHVVMHPDRQKRRVESIARRS